VCGPSLTLCSRSLSRSLSCRIGYNNVCVGFDMPPASYVAMPVLALSVAMGCVYSWMDTQRGYLQLASREINQKEFNFTYWSNMSFCFSLSLIPLIMVMTPQANAWGHLLLFIQHIVIKTMIVSANFYEAWDQVSPKSKKWFWGCWTVSTVYPALLIINFAYASHQIRKAGIEENELAGLEGFEPLIPWWITMFFDLSWFAFLATTSRFLPPAPHIKVKYSLVTDGELAALHEKSTKTWKKARLVGQIARQRGDTFEKLKAAQARKEGEGDGTDLLADSQTVASNKMMELVAQAGNKL